MGPSDIQGFFDRRYDRWIVAVCEDQVILWQDGETSLEYWPRAEEGITLVPVPERQSAQGEVWVTAVDVPEGTASARLKLTVSCWYQRSASGGWTFNSRAERPGDMPPLTRQWKKTYFADGELMEDGAFLFHVAAEEERWESGTPEKLILSHAYEWKLYWYEQERRAVDCTMEAVFYGEDGQMLEKATLATTKLGGGPWMGN